MKRKLTKREFILIIILAAVVVIVVPYVLLVQPAMTKDAALTIRIGDLNVKKMDDTAKLAQAQAAQKTLEEAEKEYQEKSADIGRRMRSFDIHYMVEEIAAGADITSLTIGEYSEVQQEESQLVNIYKCTVGFTMDAAFDKMLAAAGKLAVRPDVLLTQFAADSVAGDVTKGVISFDLYAIERASDTEIEAAGAAQAAAAAAAAKAAEEDVAAS